MKKHITKTKTLTIAPGLDKIRPNVAGMDIGANSIFVCAGLPDGQRQIREFLTFTADLNSMVGWLKTCGVISVAMESTGVYWIVPHEMLEEAGFEVFLVNPTSIKAINKIKTDVADCQWIQELHSYGLLKRSFRPDIHGVVFRAYVRQRKKLAELSIMHVQLMHKALTQMNIQLRQVLSDITGATGMQIIRAIVSGERDPNALAQYRNYRCKRSEPEIAKALEGNYRQEHIFELRQALEAYDFYQMQSNECEQTITEMVKNWQSSDTDNENTFEEKCTKEISASDLTKILGVNLDEIPGLDINTIIQIISETGTDMSKGL